MHKNALLPTKGIILLYFMSTAFLVKLMNSRIGNIKLTFIILEYARHVDTSENSLYSKALQTIFEFIGHSPTAVQKLWVTGTPFFNQLQ